MNNQEYREVLIKIKRANLLYDIENYAYIESHKNADTNNPHHTHLVAGVGDEGNIDIVDRVLSQSHAEIVEMLLPFTKSAVENCEISNDIENTDSYNIHLVVPASLSQTTMQLMSKDIHEYFVNRVLGEWFAVTNPEISAKYIVNVEQKREDIERVKTVRLYLHKRKLSPF